MLDEVMRAACRLILCIGVVWAAGCSHMVASRAGWVSSAPSPFIMTAEVMEEFGFETERVCLTSQGKCLSLLRGDSAAKISSIDFKGVISVFGSTDTVELRLTSDDVETFSGTVVLLHGFSATSESLAMSAMYFRFLGFDTLSPDLLGHGGSDPPIGLGVHDAAWVDVLLDQRETLRRPLVVLGNSMGAVAAVHLAQRRDDVAALILQAPMLPFDEALVNFTRYVKPRGARWIPEASLRRGALRMLARADVPLEQTDLRELLNKVRVPVLLMASQSDLVSPLARLVDLESDTVTITEVPARSHVGMAMLGTEEATAIEHWLRDTVGLRGISRPLENHPQAGTAAAP
ncbi:hypothetical protein BH23PSE2_BH23PSE2_09800 [soil metagenome]